MWRLLCTHTRFLPIEKGFAKVSSTTRSPATYRTSVARLALMYCVIHAHTPGSASLWWFAITTTFSPASSCARMRRKPSALPTKLVRKSMRLPQYL